jgi:hypothetical protein
MTNKDPDRCGFNIKRKIVKQHRTRCHVFWNHVAEGVILRVACLFPSVITGEMAKGICRSAGEDAK